MRRIASLLVAPLVLLALPPSGPDPLHIHWSDNETPAGTLEFDTLEVHRGNWHPPGPASRPRTPEVPGQSPGYIAGRTVYFPVMLKPGSHTWVLATSAGQSVVEIFTFEQGWP